MPRDAPVTSAIREARGRGIELTLSSSSLRTQGTRRRDGYEAEGVRIKWRPTKACGYASLRSRGRRCGAASARFRQQRQLPGLLLDLGLVGEVGWIGAGETVVGEFW